MSKQQQFIFWIGLVIVTVYLFTDQSFRDSIFGRGASAPTSTNAFLTAVTNQLGTSGIPASAGQPAPSNSTAPTPPVGGHTNPVN